MYLIGWLSHSIWIWDRLDANNTSLEGLRPLVISRLLQHRHMWLLLIELSVTLRNISRFNIRQKAIGRVEMRILTWSSDHHLWAWSPINFAFLLLSVGVFNEFLFLWRFYSLRSIPGLISLTRWNLPLLNRVFLSWIRSLSIIELSFILNLNLLNIFWSFIFIIFLVRLSFGILFQILLII